MKQLGTTKPALILMTVLLAGCGGRQSMSHLVIDYTKSERGAYMLNVNTQGSTKDSLNLQFLAQYFAPQEVALEADSFQAFWGDSKVPVRVLTNHAPSGFRSGQNASGAGPFAYLLVGTIHDERKEMLEALRYSLVLTVTSPKGDSIIERIPMKGSPRFGKL